MPGDRPASPATSEPFAHLARRRRRGFWLALLLCVPVLLASLSVAIVPAAAAALERDPRLLAAAIAWAADWPESTVEVGSFDASLRTWSFTLTDLRVEPPKESAPIVTIGSLAASLPHPASLWTGTVQLGRAVVVDLDVTARQQRPPEPLATVEGRPISLAAEHLELVSGSFSAPADRHLPPVALSKLAGTVEAFRWTPVQRRYEGIAVATAETLWIGEIHLEDVRAPHVVLHGHEVDFEDVTFRYGGTDGVASGKGTHLHERAATEIRVVVKNEDLARAITTATGSQSPIDGRASVDVTLRTGGELPPGGARFTGSLSARDVLVRTRRELSPLQKLFVDVAPWFALRDDGWIDVGDVQGRATFGRGWVEIHTLERPDDEHKALQAWGSLRDGEVDLRVRIVPHERHREQRNGLGVTITGPTSGPTLRLARRGELGEPPELASAAGATAR